MADRDGLERVRAALDAAGVQLKSHNDGSWRGRCPIHGGESAGSVSVRHHVPKTGGGGRAQLRCWAGCDEREVLEHVGLTLADLYDDPLPERAQGAVREHPYLGAAGQLLGVVQRFEPKTFRPLTRNGQAWQQRGTEELKATPYRLAAVVAAIDQGHPVYVVEGERDADRLAREGVAATCNAGGAGKWTGQHAQWLRGAEVIVCRDRDQPGEKHAAEVIASLAGIASSVRLVEPAEGKDVTEHLDAGRRLADLVVIKDAPKTTAEPRRSTKEEETTPIPVPSAQIYRGLLGEIVNTIGQGDHTEADPVGIYATLLAGTGALLGPEPHVMIGATRHPPLIWPLLFGSTGTGRKGETSSAAGLFLRRHEEYGRISVTGLSSGEGLIERIRDPRDEEDTGGTDDKRLLCTESEFGTVMARAKREGSTLSAVLRQAWDGSPVAVLNRKALAASSSHIAVVGHVTPREFRQRLAETEMAGGTYNRFLPLYVDRSKRLPVPTPISEHVIVGLGGRLRQAIIRGKNTGSITMNPEATQLWADELYDEFAGGDEDDQAWTEFTRRTAPYCWRIASLHAVLDGRNTITYDDMTAAGYLVRYAISTAKFVLARQLRDPRLDRIRRAVGARPEGMTRTEVSGLFSRNLPKAAIDLLLEELLADQQYEVVEVPSGGRPAVRYRRRVVSSSFVPREHQAEAATAPPPQPGEVDEENEENEITGPTCRWCHKPMPADTALDVIGHLECRPVRVAS